MDPIFASLTAGLRFGSSENGRLKQVFESPSAGPKKSVVDQTPRANGEALRRQLRLNLLPSPADDPTLPDPVQSFAELAKFVRQKGKSKHAPAPADVAESMWANMEVMGWTKPTPVQMQAIPLILAGRDVIVQAETGSGKTLAYLVPLFLSMPTIDTTLRRPKALIIEPTRELVRQVCAVARATAGKQGWRIAALGEHESGADVEAGPPAKKRKRGTGGAPDRVAHLADCDLLIATPLKLLYLLRSIPEAASADGPLSALRHVVLDEADHLLSEEGSLEQTHEILEYLPPRSEVRKHLFSATLPSSIETLAATILSPSLRVRLLTGGHHPSASSTPSLTQRLDFVNTESSKLPHLRSLIARGGLPPPVLLFVQSSERASELASLLSVDGLRAAAIHGSLTPSERDQIVAKFVQGKEIWFLVATDMFSRGVDLRGVRAVVNYDFPQSASSYVHRIGRAGRAGRHGLAVTLFTKDDGAHLRTIVNVMRNSGCEVPEWMVEGLPRVGKQERKRLRVKPPERVSVKMAAKGFDEKRAPKKTKAAKIATEPSGEAGDDEGEWLPADAF